MAIQSSINSLLSQAQSLAAFYKGFEKAKEFVGEQAKAAKEAETQTEIAAGNAPMKDGKVDPEWLKKRRGMYNTDMLTRDEKRQAQFLENKVKKGIDLDSGEKQLYNNPIIQEYLKSLEELKNEAARKVARASVEARTNSINKTKSNFDEHTANLIKKYGKGSENP